MDTSVTDHLLTTTRAVRRRLDLERPVPPELILDCLRLAIQAPSGSNAQGWRWLIVTDPDKKAALARIYDEAGGDYLRSNAGASGTQGRVHSSAAYLVEVLHRVPAMVIPCIEGRVEGASNGRAASFYGSILPAVWSFQLALRSRGLGSAWTSLHLMKEQEAADLLGIPGDVTQVALLPVAYTIGDDFKPAERRPIDEITYWETWGERR